MSIDNNKLIAEFMELEKTSNNARGRKTDDLFYINIFGCCKVENLKYNTSWDWLMPVVEKITRLDVGVVEWDSIIKGHAVLDMGFLFNDMLPVFNAVIQFINWYNDNQKKSFSTDEVKEFINEIKGGE